MTNRQYHRLSAFLMFNASLTLSVFAAVTREWFPVIGSIAITVGGFIELWRARQIENPPSGPR